MITRARRAALGLALLSGLTLLCCLNIEGAAWQRRTPAAPRIYRSPFAVVAAADGRTLYVSDRTARCVVVLDVASRRKKREFPVPDEPTGLALSADGRRLFVSEYRSGTVAMLDTASGRLQGRVRVGVRPVGLALARRSPRLFVCVSAQACVAVVDTAARKLLRTVPVIREPMFAALTPDESTLVVSNALPLGRATDPALAARVSIVDARALRPVTSVKLPPGSTNLRGVCVSPDGKWAYVAHSLGRFNVPPTQLERGWVNTNALSILDLAARRRYATVLLDHLMEGAADPYGVACSADGKRLWVSLAGTHQVAVIERARLHDLMAGKVPKELAEQLDPANQSPWQAISKAPTQESRDLLTDDLAALYAAEVIERYPCGGKGPNGIALSPNGKHLYVANYFSGTVTALQTGSNRVAATIPVGAQPPADPVRRGEFVFHDAIITFQHWHSCATCHPGEGRMDGLNWDLLNDGMGNPKNNKSLLYGHRTPPMMSLAVREDFETAVRAGFKFILLCVPEERDVQATMAYLRALKPAPSPYLGADGKLTPAARRGKAIFEGKAGCASCHPAPLFTDLKRYDVGTKQPEETDASPKYDTPTLVEVYRTAPYLHDGRALTIEEVLVRYNRSDRHGRTSKLSRRELNDLVAYVLSL